MAIVTWNIEQEVAWVRLDKEGMNTLSRRAIASLEAAAGELEAAHRRSPLTGAVLSGNARGLGAGADIGELMAADRDGLAELIDAGHRLLFRIEESPFPWLALVDGVCLGGIYELALACRVIVATPRSRVGFPEINLNIFPGLGGTQRLPRRMVRKGGAAAMTGALAAILEGKIVPAGEALAAGMVDAVVPAGEDPAAFAGSLLRAGLPPQGDGSSGPEVPPAAVEAARAAARERTGGRERPRAPFAAIEVMSAGACLPLREAIALERDRFVDIASSTEAKAGMRFFFAQQRAQKPPPGLAARAPAREVRRVGIHGTDTSAGSAIAALVRRAALEVVGHVGGPALPGSLSASSGREADVEVESLRDCDLIIEVAAGEPETKAPFYRALGRLLQADATVCSTSGLAGPGAVAPFFAEGGGDPSRLVGLHFVGPVEQCPLVEVVRTAATGAEALLAALEIARRTRKVPVLLREGSRGLLVNAGLAACLREAEALYREGTPVTAIDRVMEEAALALGPFALADEVGLEVVAAVLGGQGAGAPEGRPLAAGLCEAGRLGMASGGGYYDYAGGSRGAVFAGLGALAGKRGERMAPEQEIVERCLRALWHAAEELLRAGVVESAEEADLAFVLGMGFAMHLGGPFFYAAQQGWR